MRHSSDKGGRPANRRAGEKSFRKYNRRSAEMWSAEVLGIHEHCVSRDGMIVEAKNHRRLRRANM